MEIIVDRQDYIHYQQTKQNKWVQTSQILLLEGNSHDAF